MFNPPLNNIAVSFKTKYIGNYSNIMKAANLNPGNQLNPFDLVNIVCEVVALPKAIGTGQRGYEGFTLEDIAVGDTAIVRYDVVGELVEVEFSDVPLYKNMVYYKQKEVFLADIQKVFAVIKKGTQEVKMLNGYCMLEDIEDENRIFLLQSNKRMTRAKAATLSGIGNPLKGQEKVNAEKGDRILVHPYKLQNYQINSKKFAICKQEHLFGKVIE